MSKNSTAPQRRKVTISVDFDVELDEGIETHEVTFDIDVDTITPMSLTTGKMDRVGVVTGYTTQENPE